MLRKKMPELRCLPLEKTSSCSTKSANWLLELQLAVAVLDVQVALGRDGKHAVLAGKDFPAGQVAAVEDRFQRPAA